MNAKEKRYWMVFQPSEGWKTELNSIVEKSGAQLVVVLDMPHRYRADCICNEETWILLKKLPQFKLGGVATILNFESVPLTKSRKNIEE